MKDILQYESKVWETADLLIGAGIKQSDFPKYMMPFFALIMVESRLLRLRDELIEELKEANEELSEEDFNETIKEYEQGYNKYIFEDKKTLSSICKNDKTFTADFDAYLSEFDEETKDLLGVAKSNDEVKYLDISGLAGLLRKKNILLPFVKAWSEIDLKPFDNSEITTLEEHIKRKWADISAETAGEQYTPNDIIALITEIIISKVDDSKKDKYLTIYDPTCGGGNMLYGVEDKIKKTVPNSLTKTYGQDWNDALYALAKIEGRFRNESSIEYGNTLVDDKFAENEFDIVVANPPYGVDWKGYKQDIQKDKTERFHALPSVSDGQLLFMQHLISKMGLNGMGVVVHNGSTLFSGDAGSGESEIRKWMFEQDIVEAIIQLPTDEFFNTGIFTYLWVLNKNKKHTDKVMMINASEKYTPLKKNKGKKRKEIDRVNQIEIVETLTAFEDNDYAKVFDKEFFYYNKQALQLTNLDYNGVTIEDKLQKGKKSIKLGVLKVEQDEVLIDVAALTTFDSNTYGSLQYYFEDVIKENLKVLDYKEENLKVTTKDATYFYDEDRETIVRLVNEKEEELGCGKIVIKSTYKKATNYKDASKNKEASIVLTAELVPDYQKDYEVIPYDKDKEINQKNIDDFMVKHITKPFILLTNVIGVEINFNKIFFKPKKLRELEDIVADLKSINDDIKELENGLVL